MTWPVFFFFGGHAHAYRDDQAAAERAAFAEDAPRGVDDVHDAALAVVGAAGAAGAVGEHGAHADAAGDHVAGATVRVEHRVVVLQRRDGGDLSHLLPGARVQQRGHSPLHGQLDEPVLEDAGQQALAEDVRQKVVAHAALLPRPYRRRSVLVLDPAPYNRGFLAWGEDRLAVLARVVSQTRTRLR